MFWSRKHTNFQGGGLHLDTSEQANMARLSARVEVPAFTAPVYIDNRSLCLPADDQGQTSMCAGYAMAGFLEQLHWRQTHVAVQYDAVALYKKAKELDESKEEGTTLDCVARAAILLGMCPGATESDIIYVLNSRDLKFSLHEYGAVVGGFNINEAWNYTNSKTGFIGTRSGSSLGGHAVKICGYATKNDAGVTIQNSWGKTWGCNGFGRMTWDQLEATYMYGLVIRNIDMRSRDA